MNPDSTMRNVQDQILAGLEPVQKHGEYFPVSGISFRVPDTIALTFLDVALHLWVWSGAPHPT